MTIVSHLFSDIILLNTEPISLERGNVELLGLLKLIQIQISLTWQNRGLKKDMLVIKKFKNNSSATLSFLCTYHYAKDFISTTIVEIRKHYLYKFYCVYEESQTQKS